MPVHYSAAPFIAAVILLLYDSYTIRRWGLERSRAFKLAYGMIFLGSLLFVAAFFLDDFTLAEVYTYSWREAPPALKLAASWSGRGGSIAWWLLFFALAAFIHRVTVKPGRMSGGIKRRLLHQFEWYNIISIVMILTLFSSGAFDVITPPPVNGLGLNPLLRSFWVYFHPPAALLSYALGLIVGITALTYYRDRMLNITTNAAWIASTLANVLGGIWAYFTLGWGGYWAWDPVETGLLLPWLTLTAYFHARVINGKFERLALALTGFSVAYAAFVTRGGAYSPLHGFGGVSTAGILTLIIGLPFLAASVRELLDITIDDFKDMIKSIYELSMGIAYLSVLSIFGVSFIGLLSQSIYNIVYGEQLMIDVNYYNYLSFPFAVAFLAAIPGCSMPFLLKRLDKYVKYVVLPTAAVGVAGVLLTVMDVITWCEVSPPATNSIISFTMPFALVALATVIVGILRDIKVRSILGLSIKVLHLSIPLMIVGILLSGPYAYNNVLFRDYRMQNGEPVSFDGVKLEYVGAEFLGLSGKVAIPLAHDVPLPREVPEEATVRLKFKVYSGGGEQLSFMTVKFNMGAYLKGMGGVVAEPMVVGVGVDELYYTLDETSFIELFYYYAKLVYEYTQGMSDENTKNLYMHLLFLLSRASGTDYNTFMDRVKSWSPEDSKLQDMVILSYKKVPSVLIVWISSAIMVVGGLLAVIIRNILTSRTNGN